MWHVTCDMLHNYKYSLLSYSPVPPIADNLHVNLTWKIANLSQQLACQLDHATCWQLETCQLELATWASTCQQLACQLDLATCWQLATCQLELATCWQPATCQFELATCWQPAICQLELTTCNLRSTCGMVGRHWHWRRWRHWPSDILSPLEQGTKKCTLFSVSHFL